MSRNRHQSDRQTNAQADTVDPIDDAGIAKHAWELYGSEAPTAVALCGLEAWFEGEDEELRRWAHIYRRLAN